MVFGTDWPEFDLAWNDGVLVPPTPDTKFALVIFLNAPEADVSDNKIKSSVAIEVSAVWPVIALAVNLAAVTVASVGTPDDKELPNTITNPIPIT